MRRTILLTALIVPVLTAAEPLVSGLKPGQRPGPYSAVVCTGPERGKLHCFICEAADRPVVILMARKMSEPLGKLASGVDQALTAHKAAELRGWVTFFNDDQSAVDAQVVQWGKTHGLGNLPIAVFEDVDGPPAYRVNKDAEITVLLSVKQKVVKNFSFRAGELNDQRIKEVLNALPLILPAK
jgi:hypothetical protein